MSSIDERPRFLSEAECKDIAARLARFSVGGGLTTATIYSDWTGNVRWARNQISTSGDVRNNHVIVERNINGALCYWASTNDLSDRGLVATVRRAERMAKLRPEAPQSELWHRQPMQPTPSPSLFSESTYQLDDEQRAGAARTLAQSAVSAGMLSAGYVEASARSVAQIDSDGRSRYFQYTSAQYTVTVRDPNGVGSGWAGVDWHDWGKIDGEKLSAIALDKCLTSRNPVRVEPGRYTTILEPQAVCDFVGNLTYSNWGTPMTVLNRPANEYWSSVIGPFADRRGNFGNGILGTSHLGHKVMDDRITISADPMDPDCGFPPFDPARLWPGERFNSMFQPTTWVDNGVLKTLDTDYGYAVSALGRPAAQMNQGAMHLSGGTTSIDEMVSTTKRGLLVTRFSLVEALDFRSTLVRGYTRDGLWLIEDGKITKPCKNLVFTEAITAALNNVEALGVSQRTFHPAASNYRAMPQPVFVPAMKIRDFNFTSLTDAI